MIIERKAQKHIQRALELMSFGGSVPTTNLLFPEWNATEHIDDIFEKHIKGLEYKKINQSGSFNMIWFFGNKVLRVAMHGVQPDDKLKGEEGELTEKMVNDSIQNWNRASQKQLVPNIEWIGLVRLNNLSSKNLSPDIFYPLNSKIDYEEAKTARYMVIIMEAYEQDLHAFIKNKINTGSHLGPHLGSIEVAIEQAVQKLWHLAVDLGIGCVDTKPQNIVVNTQPVLDVRLIDLEGDYCLDATKRKKIIHRRSYRKAAFVLSLCFLALHSLKRYKVNLFLPFLREVVQNQNQYPEIPEIKVSKATRRQIQSKIKKWRRNRKHAFGMDDEMFTGIPTNLIKTAWNIMEADFIAHYYFCVDSFEEFFFMSKHQSLNVPSWVPDEYKNFEDVDKDHIQKLMHKLSKAPCK